MSYRGPTQELPADFATLLRQLHHAHNPDLGAVIAAAKAKGWHHATVARAIGFSRERARQLGAAADWPTNQLPPIPDVPPKADKPRRMSPRLTEEEARQIQDLHRRAKPTGKMTHDHPAYQASRELNALLNEYRQLGHRQVDLARVLGVTELAIHARLGRGGYRQLPPSMRPKTGTKLDHRTIPALHTDRIGDPDA